MSKVIRLEFRDHAGVWSHSMFIKSPDGLVPSTNAREALYAAQVTVIEAGQATPLSRPLRLVRKGAHLRLQDGEEVLLEIRHYFDADRASWSAEQTPQWSGKFEESMTSGAVEPMDARVPSQAEPSQQAESRPQWGSDSAPAQESAALSLGAPPMAPQMAASEASNAEEVTQVSTTEQAYHPQQVMMPPPPLFDGSGALLLSPLLVQGSGSTTPLVPLLIKGQVSAGPVLVNNDLSVVAYAADGKTELARDDVVEAGGVYSMTLTNGYQGVMILRVKSRSSDILDYLNEASGVGKDLSAVLSAVVDVSANTQEKTIYINPLTDLAARKLGVSGAQGAVDAQHLVVTTNQAISRAFLGGEQEIVDVLPQLTITASGGSNSQANLMGFVLDQISRFEATPAYNGDTKKAQEALAGGVTLSAAQANLDTIVAAIPALARIEAYNNGDDVTMAAPSLSDYIKAGVVDVNDDTLAVINAKVQTASPGSADTVDKVQALVASQVAALAKIANYADSSTNPVPSVNDYLLAGVMGVTEDNLTATNARVDGAIKANADQITEVQGLATSGAADQAAALAKIEAYNNGDGTTPAALSQSDYAAAGVAGVTSNNLVSVNAKVLAASAGGADTVSKVNALASAGAADQVTALAKITNYADVNTNPAPLVNDYLLAGVTGVTTDNLAAINARVDAATKGNADQVTEVQGLATSGAADQVVALAKIEAYNNGDGTTPGALSLSDYATAGVAGVTADNLTAVNAKVLAASAGGADTVSKVNALASAGAVDQAAALTKIANYADVNTNPAPSVNDYLLAGVMGVTEDNLTATNARVDGAIKANADQVTEVQGYATSGAADQIAALAKIEAYNNGDGTTPAALSLSDYATAGVAGVTADNLAAVNAKVLASSTGGANTVSKVNALASAGAVDQVAALAKIANYADVNTNPAPSVNDYFLAGVKNVSVSNLKQVNHNVDQAIKSGADSVSKVQSLADTADLTPPAAIDLISGISDIQSVERQYYIAANAGAGKDIVPNVTLVADADVAKIILSVGGTGDVLNDILLFGSISKPLNIAADSGSNITINGVAGVDWHYSVDKVLTLSKTGGGIFTSEQLQRIEQGLQFKTTSSATAGDRAFTLVHQDAASNTGVSATETVTVETSVPKILNITSSSPDGSYKAGASIALSLMVDEDVTASTTLVVTLETGATDQQITLTRDAGNARLFTGTYIVQPGDASADLSVTGVALGTSMPKDTAGNSLSTTLPAGNSSLEGSKALVIDTTAPSLNFITPSDASGDVGVSSNLVLGFNETVAKGTGSILIHKVSDNSVVATLSVASATITGSGVSTQASIAYSGLSANTHYYVTIDAGAFLDTAGNPSAVASATGAAGWDFTTASSAISLAQVAGNDIVNASENSAQINLSGTISGSAAVMSSYNQSGLSVSLVPTVGSGTVTAIVDSYNTSTGAWAGHLAAGSLVDGKTYTAAVTASGGLAGTLTSNRSVTVDTSVPTITNVTSSWGANLNIAKTASAQTITVVTSGVENGQAVKVTVNGTDYTGNVSSNSATINVAANALSGLTSGSNYTLTANVSDAAGNLATANTASSFSVDTIAPTITSVTPSWGSNLNIAKTASAQTITVATIGVENGQSVKVTINGVDYTGNVSSNSATISLAANALNGLTSGSNYTLTANVSDAAGNPATANTASSFSVDTTVPSITSVTPSWGSSLNSAETGSAQTVTVATSGVENDQIVTVRINGVDYSGNVSSNSANINVAANALSGLTSGSNYTLTANVSDAAGNPATANTASSFSVDTTAPSITSVTPSWGSNLNIAKTASAQTITVATIGVENGQSVKVTINGVDYTGNVSSNSATINVAANALNGLTSGSNYTLTANVSDAAGNPATANTAASFSVDTTAPTITSVTPSWGSSLNIAKTASAQTITVATIGVENGQSVKVTINGVDYTGNVSSNSATINVAANALSGLSSGSNYTLTANVSDAAGNPATANTATSFAVDTTAPSITIVTPSWGSSLNIAKTASAQTITVAASGVENGQNVKVTLNGVDYTGSVSGNSATINVAANAMNGLTSGSNYTLTANVSDAAGNPATANSTTNFSVDTVAPTISSITSSTVDGTYGQGATIALSLTTSEDMTASSTLVVTLATGGAGHAVTLTRDGSNAKLFTGTYTVAAGETSADLGVSSVSLGMAVPQDAAGNNLSTTLPTGANSLDGSKALVIDAVAPTGILNTKVLASDTGYQTINSNVIAGAVTNNGDTVLVQSNKLGKAYLVKTGNTVTTAAALEALADNQWNSVAITATDTNTDLSTTGLAAGSYKLYLADGLGNLQTGLATTVTVIDGITLANNKGNLLFKTTADGDHNYYHWDISGDGTSTSDNTMTFDSLEATYFGSNTGAVINESNRSISFATVAGVTLDVAMPTDGLPNSALSASGYKAGTLVNSGTSVNATYDDYLAIWDSLNGAGTVAASDSSGALTGVPAGWVDLYWAATPDVAGNHVLMQFFNAYLATYADTNAYNFAFEVFGNTTQSVAITSTPTHVSNTTYEFGETINFNVSYDSAVTVAGTPYLNVQVGSTQQKAYYSGGSGTSNLIFSYTVGSGDIDTNGVSITQNTVTLNGGSLKTADGSNASLKVPTLSDQAGQLVDAPSPVGTLNTKALSTDISYQAITSNVITGAVTNHGDNVLVQSNQVGKAYLVNTSNMVTNVASITGLADDQWNSVDITTAGIDTNLSTTGLAAGSYKLYVANALGNLQTSLATMVNVVNGLTLGENVGGSGVNLQLLAPATMASGKVYYYLDQSGDGLGTGAISNNDKVTHQVLDSLLNAGADTTDTQSGGAIKDVDDARTLVIGGYTVVLPTTTEMTALQNDPLPNPPTGWSTNNWYWSATSTADNSHNYHYFINGTSGPNADMNAYFTAFQVL